MNSTVKFQVGRATFCDPHWKEWGSTDPPTIPFRGLCPRQINRDQLHHRSNAERLYWESSDCSNNHSRNAELSSMPTVHCAANGSLGCCRPAEQSCRQTRLVASWPAEITENSRRRRQRLLLWLAMIYSSRKSRTSVRRRFSAMSIWFSKSCIAQITHFKASGQREKLETGLLEEGEG